MTKTTRHGHVLALFSELMLYLAVLGMVLLIAAYLYEIVARYFFAAPTTWANELVSIVLSLSVFFAMPKVAAEGGHVVISLLQDSVSEKSAVFLRRALLIVAALTCLTVAGIAASVAVKQVASGVMTMGNHPIPKSIVTIAITLGFALSGLQYLNNAFTRIDNVGDKP